MSKTTNCSRRQFAKSSITLTTALAASGPAINVLGANEKIQLGFIGLGGRGSHHVRQFLNFDDVDIVSLCDCYKPAVEQNAERVGQSVQKTQDFREVIDNNDVDAVVIASTDHWHTIQAILACQAGKDVYVEKPMSHSIEESKRLMKAVEKTGRVVQVGQQQRSSKQFIQAVEMVKNGDIGKVTSAQCINIWPLEGYLSLDLGTPENTKPPEGLDFDLFLGPAPKRPYNPNFFQFNFYFFLDFSGGMLTAWGVHLFDIVYWAMGPEMNGVCTYGGKYVRDDMRDTPDTAEIVFDTPGYTYTYSMRHGNGFPETLSEDGIDHGVYFYGDKATILVNRRHLIVYPENDRKNPEILPASGGDEEHKQNFLECIRSRKQPVCTVKDGHYANLPGMLGLISWRVGREIKWDPKQETIIGDSEALALMSKDYRKPWVLPEV